MCFAAASVVAACIAIFRTMARFLVILDVDGVTRRGVTDVADPRVLRLVQRCLAHNAADATAATAAVRVVFLSGTPARVHDHAADASEDWRRANVGLDSIFGDMVAPLLAAGTVSIYGQLGMDRLSVGSNGEVVGESVGKYSAGEVSCICGHLLGWYFKMAAEAHAAEAAEGLKLLAAAGAAMTAETPAVPTPDAYAAVCGFIRARLDPHFRLISNGGNIEFHDVALMHHGAPMPAVIAELRALLDADAASFAKVPSPSGGVAHRGDVEFRFLIVTLTNKGATVDRLVTEDAALAPAAARRRILTVGDTQIDYPMHSRADVAFHVGAAAVWEAHRGDAALQHVNMVAGNDGRDMQNTDGTVAVLEALDAALTDGTGDDVYASTVTRIGGRICLPGGTNAAN
jgi:hypothetical protein